MNKELAKTLTTALVQFIDRERPEGTMCCSNAECESIEQMFEGGCYDVVEKFIKKKLEIPLTLFQQCLNGILRKVFFAEVSDPTSFIIKCIQDNTKELLALAKKELVRRDEVITLDNLPPYDKGFQDGKAEAMTELERTFECNPDKLPLWLKNELTKKHLEGYTLGKEDTMRNMMDYMKDRDKAKEPVAPVINLHSYTPPCYNGGPCTNPQKDCINCPRANMVISPNTASGTSTLKAEG